MASRMILSRAVAFTAAEMKRELLLRLRYPLELLGGLVVIGLMYLLVVFTGSLLDAPGGAAVSVVSPVENYRQFTAVILGVLVVTGLGLLPSLVDEEYESGTLEYFFLSGMPPVLIFSLRYLVGSIYATVMAAALVYATYSAGDGPPMALVQLVALVLGMELGLLGAGLLLCGAALRFKKIGPFMGIAYVGVFLAMVAAYAERSPTNPFQWVPVLGPASALINYRADVSPGSYLLMLAVGLASLAAGAAVHGGLVASGLRRGSLFLR